MTTLHLGPDNGRLTIHTGVAGAASRAGHNLVIVLDRWSADVAFEGEAGPDSARSVELTAEVDSLRIESGSGGVTPLSPLDRRSIRSNALKTLKASTHPEITFRSVSLEVGGEDAQQDAAEAGAPRTLVVSGDVTIAGHSRPLTAEVTLARGDAAWTAEVQVAIVQSDFGIKPYSTMLGQLKVSDEVRVGLSVVVPDSPVENLP